MLTDISWVDGKICESLALKKKTLKILIFIHIKKWMLGRK